MDDVVGYSDVAVLHGEVEGLSQRISSFVLQQEKVYARESTPNSMSLSQVDVEKLDAVMAILNSVISQLQPLRDRALTMIGREKNRNIAINRLPVEILCKIFRAVAGERSLSTTRPFTPLPLDASNSATICLSCVCSHWRRVTADHSLLWTTIVTTREAQEQSRFRALSLAGRDAPLEVYIRWLGCVSAELHEDLSSRCGQLRKLHIASTGPEEHSKLQQFCSEAPLLTSLCIAANDDDYTLPLLFNDEMPSLKFLTLGHLTRVSNKFSHITRLRLFRTKYSSPATFMDMLAVLQRSPALEQYVIEEASVHSFDIDDSDDLAEGFPPNSITLPLLTHISFKACHESMVSTIARVLELPNGVLALNLSVVSSRSLEYLLFTERGSAWKALQKTFTTLHMSFDPEVVLAGNQTAAIRIREPLENMNEVHDTLYRPRQLFHYTNLQSLSLLAPPFTAPGNSNLWRDIFASLSSLTKLFLRLQKAGNYVLWLEALTTRDRGSGPFPAPALRTLCITSPTSIQDDPDLLTFMVMDRDRAGYRLQTLQVVYEKTSAADDEQRHDVFMFWKAYTDECERYVREVKFEEHDGFMPGPDIPVEFEDWGWASTLTVP